MLICSFGWGTMRFADANQSASTIGAASGSSRMSASICSGVFASKRDQSVRRCSTSPPRFFIEECSFTGICLSSRNDTACHSTLCKDNSQYPIFDLAERQKSDLSVTATLVNPTEYQPIPYLRRSYKIYSMLANVLSFFVGVPLEERHYRSLAFVSSVSSPWEGLMRH